MKVQETYRISKKLKKKRNSPYNMITKTLNVPKKRKNFRGGKEKRETGLYRCSTNSMN